MYDISQITPYFIAAAAGVIAAIALLSTAIVLNHGFWNAPGSPCIMIAAGVSSFVAVAALAMASGEISSYYESMNSPAACAGVFTNVMNALTALNAVLSIQATACFVAALIVWIPWSGTVPLYVILASLIGQLVLLPSLYLFIGHLSICLQNAEAEPCVGVIVTGAAAVAAVTIGLTVNIRRVGNGRGHKQTERRRYYPERLIGNDSSRPCPQTVSND